VTSHRRKVCGNLPLELLEVFGINIDIQRREVRACTPDILVQQNWDF